MVSAAGKLSTLKLVPGSVPTSLENGQCLPDFHVRLLDAWGYPTSLKSFPAVKALRLRLAAIPGGQQQQQPEQNLLLLDSPSTDERAGTSCFPCSQSQQAVLLQGLKGPKAVQLTVMAVAADATEVTGVTGVLQNLELQPSKKPNKMLLYRHTQAGEVKMLPCVVVDAGAVGVDTEQGLPQGLLGPVYECR